MKEVERMRGEVCVSCKDMVEGRSERNTRLFLCHE